MRTDGIFCFNGESGCLLYFSEKYGIPYDILRGRIRKKWTIERALTTPVRESRNGKIEFKGLSMSISEWSGVTGIPENVITNRIYGKNWTVEKALTVMPKKNKKNKTGKGEKLLTFNGETHNMLAWSSITGISRHTIRTRLSYGWSVEKTLTTPVREYKKQ